MTLLVRRIQRSKWRDCSRDSSIPVNADALTNCLKTTNDTLSVWAASDEHDLVNAKIALIGTMTKLEKIDIVVLAEADLVSEQIKLLATPGTTVAKPFVDRHRDLAHLTVNEMSKVASLVQSKLVAGEAKRLGKPELTALFKAAIDQKLIAQDDLSDDIRNSLANT